MTFISSRVKNPKMGFAIKCYFDEKSAAPIYKIWQSLAETGLADFMLRSGSRPGLTLGIWENADEVQLRQFLTKFMETFTLSAPTISSYGIACFPTNPAQVFLGIVPTLELIEFHKNFHNSDKSLSLLGSAYYSPGNWVPHSTLAIRCRPQDISKIIETSLTHETRLEFKISSIGIVETGTVRQIAEYNFI
jgi:hypothetical protein